jgi:hypothetical protein
VEKTKPINMKIRGRSIVFLTFLAIPIYFFVLSNPIIAHRKKLSYNPINEKNYLLDVQMSNVET